MSEQENGGNQIETLSQIKKRSKKMLRRLVGFALALCLLVSITIFAGILWLKAGIDSPFLTAKIADALRDKIGDIAAFDLTKTRLSLDENNHFILQASDVTFKLPSGGVHVDKIGQISAVIDMVALIKGQVRVTHVAMRDLVVKFPSSGGGKFWDKLPQDELGRVDFDATSDLIFNQLDKVLTLFSARGIDALVFDNMAVHFSQKKQTHMLQLDNVRMERQASQMSLVASLQGQGKPSTLRATFTRHAEAEGSDFSFSLNDFPLHLGTDDAASPLRADGRVDNNFFRLKGLAFLDITGFKADGEGKDQIQLDFQIPQAQLDLGTYSDPSAFLTFRADYQYGSDMVRILPDSALKFGSLQLPLDGFFAPMPSDGKMAVATADIKGKYHFKFKTQGAEVAPEESPEQKMMFSAQASGHYQQGSHNLDIDELTVLTAGGSVITGQGGLHVGAGSPGVALHLETEHITTSEAKQLWPINLNPSSRRWVLSHIKAGALADVSLDINLPQGFYREGRPAHPLSQEQVI